MTDVERLVEEIAKAWSKSPSVTFTQEDPLKLAMKAVLAIVLKAIERGEVLNDGYSTPVLFKPSFREFMEGK